MQRSDLARYDLPDSPGIYIFQDADKKPLYVGKATSLRDRVRSYFAADLAQARSSAIVSMVDSAEHLDWQPTDSVLEALILEANLIKQYQPRFNVIDKDNKSFNYLIITKEDFPRVAVVRGRELFQKWKPSDIKYTFGPYPQGTSLKEALKLVRRIFPYRDECVPCPAQKDPRACKPCFNRQIGLCPGVCSGEMSKVEYKSVIQNIVELFSGKMPSLRRRLEREMKEAAKTEQFEKAEILRRQVAALTHVRDVSLIKDEHRVAPGGGVRIEAYDVAHTGGSETVGVMVVVVAGEAQKGEYRKFIIKSVDNNDPAALKEVLARRLGHPEWAMPRIIVVDGGVAQLRTARIVLNQVGVQIPIVGVVKDEHHRPERLIGDTNAIAAYEKDILLANAEAHRFAIEWHRKRLRNVHF